MEMVFTDMACERDAYSKASKLFHLHRCFGFYIFLMQLLLTYPTLFKVQIFPSNVGFLNDCAIGVQTSLHPSQDSNSGKQHGSLTAHEIPPCSQTSVGGADGFAFPFRRRKLAPYVASAEGQAQIF